MLTKWGAAAATVVAGVTLTAAQPSFPSLPPNPPSIDFPLPKPGPTGTATPPRIDPVPPTGPSVPPTRKPVDPVLTQSLNLQLKVERDGRLTVREQVVVQARQTMTRTAPLHIGDRAFTVRDIAVRGDGTAQVVDDALVLRLNGGASTVTYTVDGAVADLGDHLEVRWPVVSGWDTRINRVRASLLTPKVPRHFTCLSGPTGSTEPCRSGVIDATGVLRVAESDLDVGSRVDLAADLEPGAVPVNARFERAADAAFALTPLTGTGLGLVLLFLVAGFAVLWLARGRDAKAVAAEVAPIDLLARDGDRVRFASPDGILPGQVGTVVDERVDARDLSATVLDLAVRNYLWIIEVGGDWQIVRRNPADDALTPYERAVYDTIVPDGVESVTLSALRETPPDLGPARAALYADAIRRDWFGRHPRGVGRWGLAGAVVLSLGTVATVLAAALGGPALLGIAVAAGGLGLLIGARLAPARTKRGSVLVQQVKGVRGFLHAARPNSIPAADRESVFSRSLPYAVALGETERWLAQFGDLDSAADGTPGLYWYATQDQAAAHDQARFVAQFQAFVAALDEVFAKR